MSKMLYQMAEKLRDKKKSVTVRFTTKDGKFATIKVVKDKSGEEMFEIIVNADTLAYGGRHYRTIVPVKARELAAL